MKALADFCAATSDRGDTDIRMEAAAAKMYNTEVGWDLSCSDGASLSGGAPFTGSLNVAGGSTCTLSMTDSYGDGWNYASWEGFSQSITLASGAAGSQTFVVLVPPAPPSSPPSPPLQPPLPPSPPLQPPLLPPAPPSPPPLWLSWSL